MNERDLKPGRRRLPRAAVAAAAKSVSIPKWVDEPAAAAAPACVVCGCTETRACLPQGCLWVTRRPPICSSCVTFLINIRDPAKLVRALEFFGLAEAHIIAALVRQRGEDQEAADPGNLVLRAADQFNKGRRR